MNYTDVPHGWWEWAIAIVLWAIMALPLVVIAGIIVYNAVIVPIVFIGRAVRSVFGYLDRPIPAPAPRQSLAERRRADVRRAIEVDARLQQSGADAIERMRRHAERR